MDMNPIQFMQSIAKNSRLQGASGVVIKPGQIIHGRIEKLFPNNMALVQVGNLKLHAHIEVSLEAMNRYWFEVQKSDHEEINLKVIENKYSSINHENDSLRSLLKQFQLSESKQNLQLLQFLLSKDLPFTKEQLMKSSHWLKETNDVTKGLIALGMMVKKDLPFTDQTFKSMVAVQGSQSLATEIGQLSKWLENTKLPQSETINQLKTNVANLIGNVTLEQAQKVIHELAKMWLLPVSTKSTEKAAMRLLQKLEIIPEKLNQDIAISKLAKNIKGGLPDLLVRNQELIAKFVETISSSQLTKVSHLMHDLFQNSSDLTQEDTALLKQLRDQFFPQKVSLDNGIEVKNMIKQMITSLGIGYEKEIELWAKSNQDGLDSIEGLKPSLLKVMNELGAGGRELEPFVNRLTGLQLLSQETHGPLQQIVMQIPLSLGTKQSDLTLQWNGRRKEDGQIDPGYCRILFYLDLENIEQTIIDMQVQNRIISITVMNDSEGLEENVTELGHLLKEQLNNMNYYLSSVKVVSSLSKQKSPIKTFSESMFSQEYYQGVDVKI
jgi:hypothetical protein